MTNKELPSLEPTLVWKYFNELRKIPRCSKNEEKAAEFVANTAEQFGYETIIDHMKNVLIRIPASPGYEEKAPTCLQCHLDMVCEKTSDVEHDFTRDPIEAYIDGENVKARGTTLGADNGIGVAVLLALLEEREFNHPFLEFLFTVDEETGLTGAFGLHEDFLTAQRLINLDSEEEGTVYIGCAGGGGTELYLPVKKVPVESVGLLIKVHKLRGGHSGVDIHLGRANAIKLLARALDRLMKSETLELARFFGGSKRNVIPREAEALVTVKDMSKAKEILKKSEEDFKLEYEGKEDMLEIEVKETPVKEVLIDGEKVIQLLLALPHGVISMNAHIENLVDTSTNLAVVNTTEETVEIFQSTRSSIIPALEDVRRRVEATGNLAGAKVVQTGSYPAWRPNLQSPLLNLARETYQEMYGKSPEVKAIHGGLETAVIGSKYPGMDMISIGATLNFPHTPDEQIHIPSVTKFYNYLQRLLQML
ncbi:MAG: aminoacyl-histidine dipeptidase [Candidatus Heimdallarchaeota archaeon]